MMPILRRAEGSRCRAGFASLQGGKRNRWIGSPCPRPIEHPGDALLNRRGAHGAEPPSPPTCRSGGAKSGPGCSAEWSPSERCTIEGSGETAGRKRERPLTAFRGLDERGFRHVTTPEARADSRLNRVNRAADMERAKPRLRAKTTSFTQAATLFATSSIHRELEAQVTATKREHESAQKELDASRASQRSLMSTINPKDLTARGPLSSAGAQGEVSKAIWKQMIPVAIKENKSGDWSALTKEMHLFLDLHHPHIVACYGILVEGGVRSIVTELCRTSLTAFLRNNELWDLTSHEIELQKARILLHVIQGLQKLHDMNVLHRDIKSGNILLDGAPGKCSECGHEGNWKICDFGEAKVLEAPSLRFAPPQPWRKGYAHSLVEARRFQPVTSSFLREQGARYYCWILAGEILPPLAGAGEPWAPCEHGGFVYLFSDEIGLTEERFLSNFDSRDCYFPCRGPWDATEEADMPPFPQSLGPFGVMPIRTHPVVNLAAGTYELPTNVRGWLSLHGLGEQLAQFEDAPGLLDLAEMHPERFSLIVQGLGLEPGAAQAVIAAHSSLAGWMTEKTQTMLTLFDECGFGDTIRGKISPPHPITMSDGDKRKSKVPTNATHYCWAYQGENQDLEQISEAQRAAFEPFEGSGEYHLVALGSFIYLAADDMTPRLGEARRFSVGSSDLSAGFQVVGVNALKVGAGEQSVGTVDRDSGDDAVTATIASPEMWDGQGIGLETDVYAFGIVMWEVWTRQEAWHWMGTGMNADFQICNRVGVQKQRPAAPPGLSPKLSATIRRCLHHVPASRPTAKELSVTLMKTMTHTHRLKREASMNVTEASMRRESSTHSDQGMAAALDEMGHWSSRGQYSPHTSYRDRGGNFFLTVVDCDQNEWMENALTGAETEPAEFTAPPAPMKPEPLGVVFKSKSATGKLTDHWPRVARVDPGKLASNFPEIKPLCRLVTINGEPAPATFKAAVPMLKKKPFTLEFATLDDAVESVLAPTKLHGFHAPVVAAALAAGVKASFLVERHEERQRTGVAQEEVARKDAEIAELKAQLGAALMPEGEPPKAE